MERPKRQWGVRKAVTSLERGGPRRAVNWIPSDNRLIISVNQVRGVGGNNNTTRRKKENTHTKKQRGNISNINRICRLIAIPRLLTISQWIGGGRVKCCLRWLLPTITAGGTSTAAAADVTATAAASAAAVVGGGFTLHIKPPGHVLKSYQSNKRIKEREKERERQWKPSLKGRIHCHTRQIGGSRVNGCFITVELVDRNWAFKSMMNQLRILWRKKLLKVLKIRGGNQLQ